MYDIFTSIWLIWMLWDTSLCWKDRPSSHKRKQRYHEIPPAESRHDFPRKGLVHPDKFISTTPHMTFAHGEEQIAWLKKRASKKHTSWLRVDFWGFTVRGIHNPPVLVMFFWGDMNI